MSNDQLLVPSTVSDLTGLILTQGCAFLTGALDDTRWSIEHTLETLLWAH